MKPDEEKNQRPDLAKMSIKAGVEGEGKPMMVKQLDQKPQIKARMQPIGRVKPVKTGDSIF